MNVKNVKYFIGITILFPSFALADVDMNQGVISSGPCPMNCDTRGLQRTVCKDWQKDGLCYVQDLRPEALEEKIRAEQEAEESTLDRKITSIGKKLKVGDKVSVKTLNKSINRVDVVVKAEPNSGNSEVNLSLAGMGGGTQAVNASNLGSQVIRFSAEGKNLNGKSIEVTALNGPVTIESVHVLYQ